MDFKESEDGLTITVAAGGFPFADFNKAGKIDIWSTSKYFESGRMAMVQGPLGLFTDVLNQTRTSLAFIRCQMIELNREFHTATSVASPWVMKNWVTFVGNTSFWMVGEMHCQKTGVFYGRSLCHIVMVDVETRRPTPLSQEKFAKFRVAVAAASTSASSPRFSFPSASPSPYKVFTSSFKAHPSDTDVNQHVNQSVFLRLCSNCTSAAAMRGGTLRYFSQDLAYYDLRSFQVEYVGEVDAGMVIDCIGWEDPDNAAILYFLLKVGERVVCRCVGEWYTSPEGSLAVTQRLFTIPKTISSL